MKSWQDKFMGLAREITTWSKDPSTKVAAIVAGPDHEIRVTGYNGFPRGIADTEERLNDRAVKLDMTAHAEENCISHAARVGVALKGCTMYVNGLPPCTTCARLIIQAGIAEIWVLDKEVPERWKANCHRAYEMLVEARVLIHYYRFPTVTVEMG